jgi:hypothetical protein
VPTTIRYNSNSTPSLILLSRVQKFVGGSPSLFRSCSIHRVANAHCYWSTHAVTDAGCDVGNATGFSRAGKVKTLRHSTKPVRGSQWRYSRIKLSWALQLTARSWRVAPQSALSPSIARIHWQNRRAARAYTPGFAENYTVLYRKVRCRRRGNALDTH